MSEVPIVATPSLNAARAKHPAFMRSIDQLRACGVEILYGPDINEPVVPRVGPKITTHGISGCKHFRL